MNEQRKGIYGTITAFSTITGIPATFFDTEGNVTWQTFPERKLCHIFGNYKNCQNDCLNQLHTAARTSVSLKEPYIFSCAAGLIKIAFPLKAERKVTGCFFLGPIFMGTSKEGTLNKLIRRFPATHNHITTLLTFLNQVSVKTPLETSYVYEIFCNSVLPYNILENNFGILPAISTISSSDDKHKLEAVIHYPETLPQDIIYAIKIGDQKVAKKNFRLFYEKTYLLETGNFNSIKIRITEMFNVLSRAISAETPPSSIFIEEMDSINSAYSFSEIYKASMELIGRLAENSATSIYSGDSSLIKDALDYINTYYNLGITLTSMAEKLHISSQYLSALFKAETGKTFSQYLMEIRLENSAKLLLNTHMSITDIAMESGFSTQSYFIKQFKKYYCVTPGSYRKKNNSF